MLVVHHVFLSHSVECSSHSIFFSCPWQRYKRANRSTQGFLRPGLGIGVYCHHYLILLAKSFHMAKSQTRSGRIYTFMNWIVSLLPQIHMLKLWPQMWWYLELGVGHIWEIIRFRRGDKGRALMMGLVPLEEEVPDGPSPHNCPQPPFQYLRM